MNGFKAWRWIERWMISPLWGLEWNKECWHCDIYTDHGNKTWMNQQETYRDGMCSSQFSRRSFRQSHLCTSVYPTDNYLSLAINHRHEDNADGLPGDEQGWKEASQISSESIALDDCVCAVCEYAKAKRTGAVEWDDAPGDFIWMAPPLCQPRVWRWNRFSQHLWNNLLSFSWERATIFKK